MFQSHFFITGGYYALTVCQEARRLIKCCQDVHGFQWKVLRGMAFLDYVAGSGSDDPFVKKLEACGISYTIP